MRLTEVIRSLDWLAAAAMMLLILIGLAMLFSANYGSGEIANSRFSRQSMAALAGLLFFIAFARLPYYVLRRYTYGVYLVGVASLVWLSFSARIIRGTVSRLTLAGIQIQPSEYMKIALVMLLAYLLTQRQALTLRWLALSALVVAAPVISVGLEPDLGMAMLLLLLWALLLIWQGLSWRRVGVLAVVALLISAAGWHYLLFDYQKARILTFIHPAYDPLGAGYNVTQSIVALGSGRIAGRGLGHGPQSQLHFLPEQHTDFIFASLGEELGFVGVTVVSILYGVLLWRVLTTARLTRDPFGQALCVGVFIVMFISFVVSAGMNMGLLPVTGIPLPLISYGGSNLVSTLILLGVVQSVRTHSHWSQAPPRELTHL